MPHNDEIFDKSDTKGRENSRNNFLSSIDKLHQNDSKGIKAIDATETREVLLHKFERGTDAKRTGTYEWAKSNFHPNEETKRIIGEGESGQRGEGEGEDKRKPDTVYDEGGQVKQAGSGETTEQPDVNNSLTTQQFFSDTVNGANQPKRAWKPILPIKGVLKKIFNLR